MMPTIKSKLSSYNKKSGCKNFNNEKVCTLRDCDFVYYILRQ